MTRCDFRSYGECGCPADACAVQKPVTQAPVVIPSWRDHLASVVFGLAVFAFVFTAMSAWNSQLRAEAKINQENVRHG